jgi:hypothetical protein
MFSFVLNTVAAGSSETLVTYLPNYMVSQIFIVTAVETADLKNIGHLTILSQLRSLYRGREVRLLKMAFSCIFVFSIIILYKEVS